jgi:hypothetical protein
MTPFPSDDARKAAHARKQPPAPPKDAVPLSKANAPRGLAQQLARWLANDVPEELGPIVVQEAFAVLGYISVVKLRQQDLALAQELQDRIAARTGIERIQALQFAAKAVHATKVWERVQVVEKLRDATRDERFPHPDVREGYLEALIGCQVQLMLGSTVEQAIRHDEAGWQKQSVPAGKERHSEGVALAYHRLREAYGGDA